MSAKTVSWSIRLLVFCLVIVGCSLGVFLWWRDGIAPVNKGDETNEQFIVKKGESVNTIAQRLSSERLIRSKLVFVLYVKISHIDNTIQAGNFRLKRSMSMPEIAHELTVGTVDVWMTFPEGLRSEEIASKLAMELSVPEEEFLSIAQEGYMFPDTYLFPKDASAAAIAKIMRDTFDHRITEDMKQSLQKQGRMVHDAVILASILEREGRGDSDRPIIAGILLKRIAKGWPLEVDATLQYALGYQKKEKTWWKKALYNEDKLIQSPYNTYKNLGFPPTPISNPGLSSLRAAISPQESDYWFYLHDPSGGVHYAKTLEEHNANIAAYLH